LWLQVGKKLSTSLCHGLGAGVFGHGGGGGGVVFYVCEGSRLEIVTYQTNTVH